MGRNWTAYPLHHSCITWTPQDVLYIIGWAGSSNGLYCLISEPLSIFVLTLVWFDFTDQALIIHRRGVATGAANYLEKLVFGQTVLTHLWSRAACVTDCSMKLMEYVVQLLETCSARHKRGARARRTLLWVNSGSCIPLLCMVVFTFLFLFASFVLSLPSSLSLFCGVFAVSGLGLGPLCQSLFAHQTRTPTDDPCCHSLSTGVEGGHV